MQCKAIQMSSPNTWSTPAWTQQAQLPGNIHLACDLKSLVSTSLLASNAWSGDTSDFWRYYSDASIVSTSRCCSDSVSSDEGSSAFDVSLPNLCCDNNNNNNSTENLNEKAVPVPAFLEAKGDTNNNSIQVNPYSPDGGNPLPENGSDNNWEECKSKNASPRVRLVDEDGFIRRAACLCVDETESKILLVSSKKDHCSWLVPGGGIEEGEEAAEAGVREAWEEAGVQGRATRYLGVFETKHHSGRKKHRTAVFVVVVKQVHAQYPEAHLGRARQWFSFEDALLHLSRNRPIQAAYLQLMLASRLKVPPA